MEREPERIKVTNVVVTNPSQLRSKTPFSSKVEVTYQIKRNGQEEFVTENDLKLFKSLFGNNVLKYSKLFNKEPMKDFKV